jgi:membrane-associated phospholipid phosphatase
VLGLLGFRESIEGDAACQCRLHSVKGGKVKKLGESGAFRSGMIATLKELTSRSTPVFAGFCWVLGYISLLLAAARLIYWKHYWAFSWAPEGLAETLVRYFLVFHLVVGPCCALGAEVVREIGVLRRGGQGRSILVLVRDYTGKHCHLVSEYLLTGLLAYCLIFGSMVGYTNLKPAIHLMAPVLCDTTLYHGDCCLLNIISVGGRVTIPRLPAVTWFFDTLYFSLWSFACGALVLSFRDRESFWRLTAAFCLAFGFSIPISLLLPSLGPAFCQPEAFSFLRGTHSAEVMSILWENHLSFLASPGGRPKAMGGGIAAMPSLHMTLACLSLTAIGRGMPSLRPALWVILLAFAVATVYLGWHYLLDGLAGVGLGWVVYGISGVWFRDKHIRPFATQASGAAEASNLQKSDESTRTCTAKPLHL